MRCKVLLAICVMVTGCVSVPGAVKLEMPRGQWTVDLRATPSDAAYTQPFRVDSVDVEKRQFTGSFYNSEITWSRYNTVWGKLVITFMTSDGTGDYVHTATQVGTSWVGSSTAKHRNLLVPWTAAPTP
jgi:hypothetical protein